MLKHSLLSASDVQENMAAWLQQKRKALKLSRETLAQQSTVPASTIKKFETSHQISLRQFILLWQSLDDLQRLMQVTSHEETTPKSIDEVLGR